MENMEQIRRSFRFTDQDQQNLKTLGTMLLPSTDRLADDFYAYLSLDRETANYFPTEEAVKHRKETFSGWLHDLLASDYNNQYLQRLQRVGKLHVKIGLKGYQVNAAMNFVRELLRAEVHARVQDGVADASVLDSLHKALDINLSVLTSSFQEEKFKKVFLSQKFETKLVGWANRLLHGLNLVLMVGLLVMGMGCVAMLVYDIFVAFTGRFDYGVIRALGSLLVLWMMIELLHTEIEHLQGGKFHVRIFVELALVAFIRKLFVASFESKDPKSFAVLLGSLLTLGMIYFVVGHIEQKKPG